MPFRGPYPTTQYTSSYSPTQQYPGRWFSPRDLGTQQSFASELWGYIVQTIVKEPLKTAENEHKLLTTTNQQPTLQLHRKYNK